MHVSRRAECLPGSAVREILDRANRLEQSGKSVLHVEIGRPWHDTPAFIKRATKEALDRGEVHYSPTCGIPDLRRAISEKLRRENGISVSPEEVLVTSGNKQATFLAMNVLLDEGDEVILTDPHYGPHLKEALFVGAVPRLLELSVRNGWRINADRLQELVSPRTRAILINSPHNPTGRVFSRKEMESIARVAIEHDLAVISDETYEYFTYDGFEHISIGSLKGMERRAVSTFALTKSYAMDGWRLGYVAAPQEVIAAMAKVVQLDTAGPNTFAQFGALAAIESGAEGAKGMVVQDRKARDETLDRLRKMRLPCQHVEGTIYAFPDIRQSGLNDIDFANRLLDEYGVALTPGSAFGAHGKGHIRIAFGAVSPTELTMALDRLEAFLGSLPDHCLGGAQ